MTRLRNVILLAVLSACCTFAQAAVNSVTLTWGWTQGTGVQANGFNVYRATAPGGPFTQVGTTTAAVLTYTDTTTATAPAGTAFYYYVTAFNTANNLSAPSAIIGIIPPPTLSAPVNVSAQIK